MRRKNPQEWTNFHSKKRVSLICMILTLCGTTPSLNASEIPTSPNSKENTSNKISLQPSCSATREFITALEFLRDYKALGLSEKEARTLADRIAEGCEGAAGRFIQVTETLSKAGLTSRDSLQQGLRFVNRNSEESNAFVHFFLRAFLSDSLDLDLASSVKLAEELTAHPSDPHRIKELRNDFDELLDFCLSAKTLDLPRPDCARLALEVSVKGNQKEIRLDKTFKNLYEFLTADSGVHLIKGRAINLAKELVAYGATADQNFIEAYRYAISPKGLALPTDQALDFAKRLTSYKKKNQN